MRDYRKSGPTAACFEALDAVHSRLEAAHEFPRDAESPESFSAILTKSMAAPIQIMTAQLQAHHKALQSLTKSVESIKAPRPEAHAAAAAATAAQCQPRPPPPKTIPVASTPTSASSCAATAKPPQSSRSPSMNLFRRSIRSLPRSASPTSLARRVRRMVGCSLFRSRRGCQNPRRGVAALGPEVFPGARVIPPSIPLNIQIDGIPHAAAPDLGLLATEFTEREAQISATRTLGKVDLAVSMGRLRLAGSAPTVLAKPKRKRFASALLNLPPTSMLPPPSPSTRGNLGARWTILTSDGDFDIICVQEPHHNEALNARDFPEYALIYPDAHDNHRVSVFVKLSKIPPSSVKSLRFALPRLDPNSKVLLVLDSNSHHPHWDLNTKPTCEDDFELHDVLISHGLLLVTPRRADSHLGQRHRPRLLLTVALHGGNGYCRPLHCLGSDHLPIHYVLDFEVKVSKSIKFNSEKMDLDAYLGILRNLLDDRPLPVISTPEELDNAVEIP
ncbi:hypothetical protein B0H14DRAFT_3523595 [Mycena olivaceomarginata]|nr:hypothetical protein B0H14DRAFT_3523595 [Mycena olivaceomarginata]